MCCLYCIFIELEYNRDLHVLTHSFPTRRSSDRPIIGLFGDHWQKIYGEGCGAVEHAALEVIDKNANFRSAEPIVAVLNRMRPDLEQIPSDPDAPGEARIFHTNAWPGQRRTGQGGGHWTGDPSPEGARAHPAHLKHRLSEVAGGLAAYT